MEELGLNERQRMAVGYVKQNGRILNKEYQQLTGVTDRTALRDLEELLTRGIVQKAGTTGRGTHYVVKRKPDRNPTKPT